MCSKNPENGLQLAVKSVLGTDFIVTGVSEMNFNVYLIFSFSKISGKFEKLADNTFA